MKNKTPKSKREFRDGTAKKPSRRPAATVRRRESPTDAPAPAKTRANRAKKLVVRAPNQKIQDRSRDLKEQRTDLSRIEPVRLQKALAASGVGSRREMEQWIENGWVSINGRTAGLGDKVSPEDQVTVKGTAIKLKWADRLPRIILYYKQEGEIVSRNDPQGRISVFDRLPQAASSRWVAIGRLDINTCGLLILTTSGELVQRFAHPSFEVEREYAVRVLGGLDSEQMRQLTEEGVMLEDGLAKLERIREQGGEGANRWYNVVIKEGRNREVRRIFEHLGLTVSRLVRTGFGPIGLPNRLKRGQFYELNPAEVANILKWADMPLPGSRRR
ncbi:rRNA pseudouridine synthase [Conchiformibius steedae DSM 2580]|uniref:Pseudouridine synthase n=1 Tax=Conchiformibius steedae DSM 2580 TaxID=1121352 RepID=A0AAE9L0D0_9NEIS|nr:pseudouridine synthase [Conchiformibius steedae]QMT33316.1 rRNA pseudouridine synthase [Conchiformibius steedae]URD67959.1 rRNA pseudouridine synthase [Conchiformibius steedae DSM 2580]